MTTLQEKIGNLPVLIVKSMTKLKKIMIFLFKQHNFAQMKYLQNII